MKKKAVNDAAAGVDPETDRAIDEFNDWKTRYQQEELVYQVRGKEVRAPLFTHSLSHSKIPRISIPRFDDPAEQYKWVRKENFAGCFPYTAGVFPLKRSDEDPTRMFAGEGGPEDTNKRFKLLSHEYPAKRLSTAFDSVTLYGFDPDIRQYALSNVRGTVQADILKEDQGQNTCIFSIEFALRMMGDIQQYFIDHQVRNFYSVSISGYHIAEAGANPITQLALTLANGFTYVEYYLSRGMDIDDFAPSLSFFFSNGMDPEYTVIGRVARRIWALAMKYKYKANEKSQKLKYHIQTSGRSLHSQEIQFNDIRTTLQGLCAIYDNCNSLHTNAFDEAITTPSADSVRRALAIQLIINREWGLAKNENLLQGSFIVDELTDLVEEAVLMEFDRITQRGGVLGAMETGYQRGKIQEESMYYEYLKHSGKYPIIGVNTFIDPDADYAEMANHLELSRSTKSQKDSQLARLKAFKERHKKEAVEAVEDVKQTALGSGNMFECLMKAVRVCSLGTMTNALYEVGGKYRRNM